MTFEKLIKILFIPRHAGGKDCALDVTVVNPLQGALLWLRLPRRQVMHSPLPTSGNWTNPGNPATRRALSSCHWQLRVWEPGTSQPSARSRSWAAASPATQGRRRRPPYATSSSNSPSPLPRAMQHCLTTESLVTARRATRVLGGRVDILSKCT